LPSLAGGCNTLTCAPEHADSIRDFVKVEFARTQPNFSRLAKYLRQNGISVILLAGLMTLQMMFGK